MTTSKRVAILTGGGDVPGLNMCIKSLVYRLIDLGFEPIGVRKGWEGLIRYDPANPSTYSEHFIELTKNLVRPIDRTPGSFLHSSRLDPRRTPRSMLPDSRQPAQADETLDATGHIQEVVQRLGYRGLIVIGDVDMLQYAACLSQCGVPIIAIPKTIHNNIHGTDYSLGFSTGLARGVSFIHELRALAGSREQIIVVETFAARSGYSSLFMAFLAGVDRAIIPEVAYDPYRLAELVLQDRRENPANYAMVTVCDGSHVEPSRIEEVSGMLSAETRSALAQSAGRPSSRRGSRILGSGIIAAELLHKLIGQEVIHQPLTYLLRTGSPDGQDLLGATNFAFIAARLLSEGVFGRMTAFKQNTMWTHVDLLQAIEGSRMVDVTAWYDQENYRPKLSLIWSVENSA